MAAPATMPNFTRLLLSQAVDNERKELADPDIEVLVEEFMTRIHNYQPAHTVLGPDYYRS